jgi:hypothetical protein
MPVRAEVHWCDRRIDESFTNTRNVSSPHWRGWLKRENRCVIPAASFCENADRKPRKRLNRPLFALAGLWTRWRGVPATATGWFGNNRDAEDKQKLSKAILGSLVGYRLITNGRTQVSQAIFRTATQKLSPNTLSAIRALISPLLVFTAPCWVGASLLWWVLPCSLTVASRSIR